MTTRTGLPPAPKRPREALAYCFAQHEAGSTAWYRLCQKLARSGYGIPPVEPDAWNAWLHARGKHEVTAATVDWTKVPVGAHLFYRGGANGHVATFIGIRNGSPLCWTNDAGGHGVVTVVHPLWFEAHWAHYLVGWTESNNGYDLGLTINGEVAPQWKRTPPVDDPPDQPPSDGPEHLTDALQHAIGSAIRINDALIVRQPNRPLFRSIRTGLSEQWAKAHDAAT